MSEILPLSKSQREVLGGLALFGEKHRRWPSVRQLAAFMRRSPTATFQQLSWLRRHGHVVGGGAAHSFRPSDRVAGRDIQLAKQSLALVSKLIGDRLVFRKDVPEVEYADGWWWTVTPGDFLWLGADLQSALRALAEQIR